ncbi:hypothetical protein D3C76_1383600 [compost metagenome]
MRFRGGSGVAVVVRIGRVVDDVHIDRTVGTAAIAISGYHREAFAQAGAVTAAMRFVVEQRVGVSHHPGAGVVARDGQGVALRRGSRLREADCIATSDHGNTADSQGLQAIRGAHGEAAALGQGRAIRVAAVAEVFLVDGQFAAFDIQAVQGYRVV